jgi:hypothetical protein
MLIVAGDVAFGQAGGNLTLNNDMTNNGTIRVRRDVVNAAGKAVTVSGTGVVRLDRNQDHNIRSTADSHPITFSNLSLTQSGAVTMQVDVTAINSLQIGDATNAYTATGNGFDIAARTLTIGNTATYLATSTAPLTFSNGTVVFNGTAAQSVLNRASGVTYGTLTLSGTGTKSLQTGGKITAATLSQSGGQLTVTEDIDVTGSASIADLGAISAGKTFKLTNTATSASIALLANSGTGTFENAANIPVTIASLTANAGTINQSGATGTLAFTNDITNSGTITTAAGTLNFNGTGTQTNTGGTISVTGAGNATFAGDIATNPGTLSFASASTVTYGGAAQNIATGVTYGNLVAGGSGAKTAAGNFTVAGNLTLSQNIVQSSGALTLTSTTANNVSGAGEVLGAVRRNHNFTSGENYRFNRADVYIGTATTSNSDITLTMTPATDPTNPASTKYVQRKYALASTTMGNLEAIQLYYAADELKGGISESKIGLRAYNGTSWSKVTNVGMMRSSGSNLMTYSGLNNSLASVTELGMYGISFVTIANNANISIPAGWDENQVPDNTDDATIAHTGVVTGAGQVSVSSLTVNAGADVTTNNAAGSISVATSTTVNGAMNISQADVTLGAITVGGNGSLSVASGRTLTGTSLTYNSSNPSTFAGNVSLGSLANNGALTFNGSNSSITDAITNASGASITVGGTLSVLTSAAATFTSEGALTLSGASAVLNVGASGVLSNLTVNNSLTLDNANSQLNVFGDLEFGSSATLNNNGVITVGE